MTSIDLKDVVDEYMAAHAVHSRAAGAPTSTVSAQQARTTLADVIAKLRARGITLPAILAVIGPILSLIFAGTPAGAIITAILALLQGVTPPPVAAGS